MLSIHKLTRIYIWSIWFIWLQEFGLLHPVVLYVPHLNALIRPNNRSFGRNKSLPPSLFARITSSREYTLFSLKTKQITSSVVFWRLVDVAFNRWQADSAWWDPHVSSSSLSLISLPAFPFTRAVIGDGWAQAAWRLTERYRRRWWCESAREQRGSTMDGVAVGQPCAHGGWWAGNPTKAERER